MTDLKDMIDDTTERLLKKIDNWEIPQSDKKFITVEKEVYESVLRVNCNKIAECERLQKQLDIAVKALKEYGVYKCKDSWFAEQALAEIKELDND